MLARCAFAIGLLGATLAAGPPPAKPTLTVTAISPDKGDADGGTYTRIIGTRFIADGARGSRQGTIVRFSSDTELIVEAPGGKVGEVVDVLLIFDPGGEIKLPKAFTFVSPPTPR